MQKPFYLLSKDESLAELETSDAGLSSKEAESRLSQYGKNSLPKKKKDSIIKIFFKEFCDPLVALLVVAIIASVIAGETLDAIVISGIILVDAIMGAFQENKANKTADSLESLVRVNTRVLRDGREIPIDAELLVPGDIVLLESGDKVPADLRLIEVHNFTVDESILTGESVQIAKTADVLKKESGALSDRVNLAYSGTTVVSGRAKAIVYSTGLGTELGKIADSMNRTEQEKSPLTIRIGRLTRQITIMIIATALVTSLLLAYKQTPFSELLITVIAFAVSAMPEGLPLALTMALTIASNRMAKRNVIVRKLKAAESLGSCTVIASDKTGTLTVNQQTAKKIVLPDGREYEVSGTGYDKNGKVTGEKLELAKELGLLGAINNEASEENGEFFGDSVDIAFLVLASKLKQSTKDIKQLEEIPYESENKYSAVFYEQGDKVYCTAKGSPEKIIEFCSKVNLCTKKDLSKLQTQNEALAREGYRVIALARGEMKVKKEYTADDIKDLTFMGMVAFIDPMRKTAKASIKKCRQAGIKVLMVTGDHPLTAFSIARDLELVQDETQVTNGEEVEEYFNMGEREFDYFIGQKSVFARVTPLQKLNIIESLKRQNEFVAVTGDGVNDAPALKSANIGVAMGSGTDIARETADMIIIDDNFESIVSGIEEGRIAYSNIRKILCFLLSCGLSEALFFCASIFVGLPMPLTAVQFLWLNIVTDGLQDFALSFERGEKDILRERPRDPKESIFDKSLMRRIVCNGLTMTIIMFVFWNLLLKRYGFAVEEARGYVMCLTVFMQNLFVLSCRSEKHSIFSVPLFRNPIVVLSIIGNILLQLIVMHFAPLSKMLDAVVIPYGELAKILVASLMIVPLVELSKKICAAIELRKKTS